jgi:cytochrome b561
MIDGKTPSAYSSTARVLHWITAVLVLIMIPLGIVIANEWGGRCRTLSMIYTARSAP